MSTELKRVRGQDVELTCSKLATDATPLSNWTKFSGQVQLSEDEATAASSGYDQFTDGRYSASGTVSGFAGGSEVVTDLPQPGDELLTMALATVEEGADMLGIICDESKVGPITVRSVKYDQDKGPASYEFTWKSGRTK